MVFPRWSRCRRLFQHAQCVGFAPLFDERRADRHSLGGHEGVSHRTAYRDDVGALHHRFENGELVRNLGAAQQAQKRVLGFEDAAGRAQLSQFYFRFFSRLCFPGGIRELPGEFFSRLPVADTGCRWGIDPSRWPLPDGAFQDRLV